LPGDIGKATILDYGCGKGALIKFLLQYSYRPKSIHAVDIHNDMIDAVKCRFCQEINSGIVTTQLVSKPRDLVGQKFEKIVCHNVLECLEDKVGFINEFCDLLSHDGILILSSNDFDSTTFNSSYKQLTRDLIHHFADTKQKWQEHCDGQMGRKIPGLIGNSVFKERTTCWTIRIVETEFSPHKYGYLLANMILDIAKSRFDAKKLEEWFADLENLNKKGEYYFAIDLVVATIYG
jgi:SAM-dependent methyltransferase